MAERGSTGRRQEIVAAARQILEQYGAEALTMRRLAEALGMRAPSLYKHFPDKAAVELALVQMGLREAGDAMECARAESNSLKHVAAAYRTFALEHAHLYRLMTTRPLPRERLAAGVEVGAAAPLMAALNGDLERVRAVWGMAHGLCLLELDGRLPADADMDAAWQAGIAAFATPERTPV